MQIPFLMMAALRPNDAPRRLPRAGARPLVTAACAMLLLVLSRAAPVAAQQFVTDDAFVVDPGACQLEGWHSESASWMLPACHFFANLEITAGVGLVREDDGRTAEYVVQGKYALVADPEEEFGIAVVAGVGLGPLSQAVGDGVAAAFAYLPLSVVVGGLPLHATSAGSTIGRSTDVTAPGTRKVAMP